MENNFEFRLCLGHYVNAFICTWIGSLSTGILSFHCRLVLLIIFTGNICFCIAGITESLVSFRTESQITKSQKYMNLDP